MNREPVKRFRANRGFVLNYAEKKAFYIQKGDQIRVYEDDTENIKVKHPGLLDIPSGKNFWEVPLSHYIDLAKKKGKSAVMHGLLNLDRWNKDKHPEISSKAKAIIDKLEKNSDWKGIASKSKK